MGRFLRKKARKMIDIKIQLTEAIEELIEHHTNGMKFHEMGSMAYYIRHLDKYNKYTQLLNTLNETKWEIHQTTKDKEQE